MAREPLLIRLRPDTKEKLARLAEADQRSLSDMIAVLIERAPEPEPAKPRAGKKA
ncbi:putative transcriptional regulator [Bradyrhizobium sp. USDA 4341]